MTQERVWFITGTSSGLGNALVHELLSNGHSVIATARKPEHLQAQLEKRYDQETLKRTLVVKLDVTQPEEVKVAFETGLTKFGRVDVVVNNAGYAVLAEVETSPIQDARDQFEVMFWGPVYVSKEAVKIFREVNPKGAGGHIFNVSSSGGYSAQPTLSYYNAAKFALEGFTESLRKEMSPQWNIQATIIEPGGFNTEWAGGNMAVLPPNPAYVNAGSPAEAFRSMLGTMSFIGNPERAAKAFLDLEARRGEMPLRVQLGSDALTIVKHTAAKTLKDSEKWEELSHSTNVDGVDAKEYTAKLWAALG